MSALRSAALLLVTVVGLGGCAGEDEEGEVPAGASMVALARGVSFEALSFHVGERVDAVVDGLAVGGAQELLPGLGGLDAVGLTQGDCFVGGCKHVFLRVAGTGRYLVVRNLYSEEAAPTVALEDDPLDAPPRFELTLPAAIDASLVAGWLDEQRRGLDVAVASPSAQAVVSEVEVGYVDAGAYLTVDRFLSTGCGAGGCGASFFALQREDFGAVDPSAVGTLVVEGEDATIVDP